MDKYYNKSFFWSEELINRNRGRFFPIYRSIVEDGTWAKLLLCGKKIYPILGIHAGKNEAFPKPNRIMTLSGYSKAKIIRRAINDLKKSKLIIVHSRKGLHPSYKILNKKDEIEENKSSTFFQIKSEYIFSGIWALLPHAAAAVYVVLGVFSNPIRFDSKIPEWLVEYAENIDDSFLNKDFFPNFRCSKLSLTQIQKYSGLSRATVVKELYVLDEVFKLIRKVKYDKDDFTLDQKNLFLIPLLHHFGGRGMLKKGYYPVQLDHLNSNNIYEIRKQIINKYNYHR